MTQPFRLAVQKAITAALEEISVADGYNFDLAGKVFRGRDAFGENDGLPLVAILEPPLPPDQNMMPEMLERSRGNYELLIQGFVKDDRQNPTDPAHMLLADVKKRIAIEKARTIKGLPRANPFDLGCKIGDERNFIEAVSVIGAGVVRPPGDGVSDKAYFWLNVTLKIVEDIANPFV